MGDYKPVPVEEARAIAERYDKAMVVINCYDNEAGTTHVTTYGRSPEQKEIAADAGVRTAKALGAQVSEATSYEDFRHRTAAEAAMYRELLFRLTGHVGKAQLVNVFAWLLEAVDLLNEIFIRCGDPDRVVIWGNKIVVTNEYQLAGEEGPRDPSCPS